MMMLSKTYFIRHAKLFSISFLIHNDAHDLISSQNLINIREV